MENTNQEEIIPIIVPLSINGATELIRIIWNYNETVIIPECLAKIIVEDNGYPANFEQEISSTIKRAIENHKRFTYEFDPEFEENILKIELCIAEGDITLKDNFEWDIYEETNNPAEFAKILVLELGLPSNFENLISFEIH